MVAVALLAVIIVGLLAMFYQTQRAFRGGTTQVDVLESGRTTVELIRRELQEVTPCSVSNVINLLCAVPQFRQGPSSVLPLPGGGIQENFLQDLSFLTKVNDEWRGFAYRVSNAVAGVGSLYRMVDRTNLNNVAPLSAKIVLASIDKDPDFHHVADGIVHFRLEAYDSDGVLITQTNNPDVKLINGYSFSNRAVPAYLDLELGILEPEALDRFNARAFSYAMPAEFLTNQVGRVHLFKKRIPIRNVP